MHNRRRDEKIAKRKSNKRKKTKEKLTISPKIKKVMNNVYKNDIIAALATPYGRSALAAIRISGKGSAELVNRFLKKPLVTGRLEFNVFDAGEFKENLTAVSFKAPRSYTGEDSVELFPHGNPIICDGIIKALIGGGARLAERGEFTERAFFNGKVDLTACEALADIIDAQTVEQLVYGNKRYDGEMDALNRTEIMLNKALSSAEAVIHYSDELEDGEVDNAVINDIYGSLDDIIKTLKNEKDKFGGGRIVNEGFKVALIGVPNAGKSTLLNALTESDRAIVTPIAGTTRDTLEGAYVYKNKKFVVTDTAGITETTDEVEKIGVSRALRAAEIADAVISVEVNGKKTKKIPCERVTIEVENKCDDDKDVGADYEKAVVNGKLRISAKNNVNITALKEKILSLCPKEVGQICNHRQYDCVCRALDACEQAKKESNKQFGLEIVTALLYEAYSAIEQLFGRSADERVLDSVFQRFCVGK